MSTQYDLINDNLEQKLCHFLYLIYYYLLYFVISIVLLARYPFVHIHIYIIIIYISIYMRQYVHKNTRTWICALRRDF